MSGRGRKREAGVALITVLLLVAVMSALAVAVLEDVRFATRRAANLQTHGQAQWYALGAETLALARIARLNDGGRTRLDGDWPGRALVFPLDDGGTITARLRDAGACFNLNSVVQGRGDLLVRREAGVRQFTALGAALGLSERHAEELALALADWIDTDPAGSGEDDAYLRLPEPYRTGSTLLAEVSEVRAVRGFTPEVYARLRPHLCALPVTDLSPVNPNTVPLDRPEVLTMLTEGRLPPETARRVLAARPQGGWTDISAFWSQPALADLELSPEILEQATLRSRWFVLEATAVHADAEAVLSSLIGEARGRPTVAARRWTPDE